MFLLLIGYVAFRSGIQRKLIDKINELQQTADERNDQELALICEGKHFMRPCVGLVVRTGELCSTITGGVFGEPYATEAELYGIAAAKNETVIAEAAYNKVKK